MTDNTKFLNWKEYGNPDGSMVSQTLDLALPSWMFDQENQIIVLCLFLLFFIIFPLIIIASIKTGHNGPERFENGIEKESQQIMMAFFFESLTRNMKKKIKVFTDDQWIECLEASLELQMVNMELAKKINIRDLIKNKMAGHKISPKF